MNQEDCQFCSLKYELGVIIRKALYEKYSSSQNYTYIRIINDLIFAKRSHTTVIFKDYLYWDYEDEYLETVISNPQHRFNELLQLNQIDEQSLKYAPRIFHQSVARTLEYYHDAHEAVIYLQNRKRKSFKTCSVSKILKTSVLDVINKQPCQSSTGSIFFIKNQLNEIVSIDSHIEQQAQLTKTEISKKLRQIYQNFTVRRQEIKLRSHRSNRLSQVHSIDKQTQTADFLYMPIIQTKDKQFLQKIVRQQKEQSYRAPIKKYENKLISSSRNSRTQRSRNSVEIHNNANKYVSAFHSSNASTARVFNSANKQLNTSNKQYRTKSQSYDSNITKALESKIHFCQGSERKKKSLK